MATHYKYDDDEVVEWADYYINLGFSLQELEQLLEVSHSTIWWCFMNRLPHIRPDLCPKVGVAISNCKKKVGRRKKLNKPTRFYSNKQEKAVAKQVGGKQVANSGATPFHKGDVTTTDWLIECKTSTTEKASFSIKRQWLDKNKEEAFAMGKAYNALCFDFGDGGQRYYVIDEKTFKNTMVALKEETDDRR